MYGRVGAFFGVLQAEDQDKDSDLATDVGVSPIVGIGTALHITENMSVRGEVEYVPRIGQGHRSSTGGLTTTTGDIDIVAGTISVLWRF